jgi:FtsH-binding integral membrane protein
MADWNDTRQQQRPGFGSVPRAGDAVARQTTFDSGLRSHMLSIYNYMTSGVLLTGIIALLVARSGFVYNIMGGPLLWIAMLAPLAIVFAMSFGANRFSETTLKALFWAYAALMGVSLSTIFVVYTGESIAVTFFATAGAFAGLSLYGYTTKKDLSGFGTFLVMGVVGLIIASLINIFLQSSALALAVSFLGVLIFAGLTAYDTQRLKDQYSMLRGSQFAGKAVVLGALQLYLDFINMFMFLLRFMGNRN